MIDGSLLIGAPAWLVPALILGSIATVAVLVAYWRAPTRRPVRLVCSALKLIGIAGLVACLVEPLVSARRPQQGANTFVLLSDDSRSMTMHDPGDSESRADRLTRLLQPDAPWNVRLQQDVEVRSYAFAQRIRPLHDSGDMSYQGAGSAVGSAIATLSERYRDRPVSGILLLTDGITNDRMSELLNNKQLPPIYPVLLASDQPVKDLWISDVSVSQTNFEEAPVTIVAEVDGRGYQGAALVAELRTETGDLLESKSLSGPGGGVTPTVRFEFRPAASGVLFYEVRVFERGSEKASASGRTDEVTLVNNRRLIEVNRGKGPFRVLYVCGRPNWEFKFLRRAIEQDNEVDLVGLLRIARRESKFDFRGHLDENTNPLYRGFTNQDDEQAEQYDEPVLMRLGTRDAAELRHGFPRVPEDLFVYDGIILDDVEAEFFTRDQLSLIQEFVSKRGGGFLMLGGQESFAEGGYRHTPIEELLPVYLDRSEPVVREDRYRLVATREGMLQPWTRLRSTEDAERQRLNAMPPLHIVNLLDSIKPGATTLSYARASSGDEYPALVAQRFGTGRTLALLVGDLWRWGLRREEDQPRDLEKSWRQTLRWLVADVPRRLEVTARAIEDDPHGALELRIVARTESYEPLDDASISLEIQKPGGSVTSVTAQPSDSEQGVYLARYVPDTPGAYKARVTATAADGSEVGTAQTGWAADPARAEFAELEPRRDLFAQLAEQTGGAVIAVSQLDEFVSDLPHRRNVVTEPWLYPFWHQWWIMALIVGCFASEWAIRRWKGLA